MWRGRFLLPAWPLSPSGWLQCVTGTSAGEEPQGTCPSEHLPALADATAAQGGGEGRSPPRRLHQSPRAPGINDSELHVKQTPLQQLTERGSPAPSRSAFQASQNAQFGSDSAPAAAFPPGPAGMCGHHPNPTPELEACSKKDQIFSEANTNQKEFSNL